MQNSTNNTQTEFNTNEPGRVKSALPQDYVSLLQSFKQKQRSLSNLHRSEKTLIPRVIPRQRRINDRFNLTKHKCTKSAFVINSFDHMKNKVTLKVTQVNAN